MNARKIVARLNAKTMNMTGVGGVPPELTATDIAGAIGMMRDKFARDMFCAIWWPDGVDLTQVMQHVAERQRAEVERQLRLREIARLEEMLAEEALAEARTPRSRSIVEKCRARSRAADALCWPPVGHILRQARIGVFTEIMHPRKCPDCHAAGYVIENERPKQCARCEGTGIASMSHAQRARMFGLRPRQFRNSRDVRPVYEWTYDLIKDGEDRGADELAKRLSDAAPHKNLDMDDVPVPGYNPHAASVSPWVDAADPGASPVVGVFV